MHRDVFAHESAEHMGSGGILLTANLKKPLPKLALYTNT